MNTEHYLDLIGEKISCFEPVSLQEMESVRLMDRTDIKYLVPLKLLPAILDEALADYRLMEIDDKRLSAYETLYYDTPDLMLYHMHHQGKKNRYKVRSRNYVESGLKFFEIKFKSNKGRTLKSRIVSDEIEHTMDAHASQFLSATTTLDPLAFSGVMWVDYKRMTLVHKRIPERITIDLQLTFRNEFKQKKYPELAIVEIKQDKMKGSPFTDIMKKFQLKKGSISKYCFGIISLFDGIKQNSFKPQIQKLNKIIKTYEHVHPGIHPVRSVGVV